MVGAGASWRSVTKFIYRKCHNFENGVQNSAASGASRNFFGFLPQIVTFLRYISRKLSQKIVEYICFEGKRQFVSPPS